MWLDCNECDRDMPHRRIGLGAMPMAFTGLDMHDITHVDLTLLVLVCHHAGARGHDPAPGRSYAYANPWCNLG